MLSLNYSVKYVIIAAVFYLLQAICQNVTFIGRQVAIFGTFVCLLTLIWFVSRNLYQLIVSHLIQNVDSNKKCVLITGCDTGFGHMSAKCLSQLGFNVFAGCLDVNSAGAKELKRYYRIKVIQLNVTKQDEIDLAYKDVSSYLVDHDYQLNAIVNNAGISTVGCIEWGKLETFQNVWRVNTEGGLRICRKFIPLLRKCDGRIINIGSVSAQVQAPLVMAYNMSKTGIRSFSQCLRREMAEFNIKVIHIEPIAHSTSILSPDAITASAEMNWNATSSSVQEDYSTSYIDLVRLTSTSTKFTSKFIISNPYANPMQVVDAIVNGVTHAEPSTMVVPGFQLVSIPVYFTTGVLPVDLIDLVFYFNNKLLNNSLYLKAVRLMDTICKSMIEGRKLGNEWVQ